MKKITFLITMLLIAIISFGQNLIENGDFETGNTNDGWNDNLVGQAYSYGTDGVQAGFVVNATYSLQAVHGGLYTGRLKPQDAALIQVQDVTAGNTYVIQFWFANNFIYPDLAAKVRDFTGDINGTFIALTPIVPDSGQNAGDATIYGCKVDSNDGTLSSWKEAKFSFTVPIGVTKIKFQYFAASGTGNHFVDDVSMNQLFSTSGSGTNWNDNNTWAEGNVPPSTNPVVIDHPVIVNTDSSAGDVALNSTLTLEKGQSLTVNGDLTNNGVASDVIINNDSNEFSSLIVDGVVTGDVRHRRFINGLNGGAPANDLISPAVTVSSFADFDSSGLVQDPGSDAVLFGIYNNNTPDYEYFLSTDVTPLNPGTGYVIGASADPGAIFEFDGTVTTGIVEVSITDPISGSPWNLIGNPYPSYISFKDFFDLVSDATGTVAGPSNQLDGGFTAIYGYNAGTDTGPEATGIWTIWDFNNTNYATDLITPGQGFFVRSKSGGGTVSFTPSMRTIGTSNDFILTRMADENFAHAKLSLTKSSSMSFTNLYFRDINTRSLDPGYDTGAYQGSADGIFTNLLEDNAGIEMANQSLPYSDLNNVVVPLGIKASSGEQISVGMDDVSNLPANINVYLEDNVANTWTLLNTGDHTFTPTVNLGGTGRFFVHFTTSTLGVENSMLNGLQIYSSANPKSLFVKGQLTGVTTANLFDIQGRKVLSKVLSQNTNTNEIDISDISTGIYVVEVSSSRKTKTQKIIIK